MGTSDLSSTESVAGIRCRQCGNPLEATTECVSLFFHCEQGHYFSVKDLLGERLTADLEPGMDTLRLWHDCERGLLDLARAAENEGQPVIADWLQKAAGEIENWLWNLHRVSVMARLRQIRPSST